MKYNEIAAPDMRDLIRRGSKTSPSHLYRLFDQLKSSQYTRRQEMETFPKWDNATVLKLKLWPEGLVPYLIDPLSFDETLQNGMVSYFQMMQRLTTVSFIQISKLPANKDIRYLIMTNRQMSQECSPLQKLTNTGPQKVVIGYNCMDVKNMAALVMEILGIAPQHNSPDRDKYITVHMDNILDDKKHLFEKVSPDLWPFNTPYDYSSISHYGPTAFTKNGKPTISVLERNKNIGEELNFSPIDTYKMNYLYQEIFKERENYRLTASCNTLFNLVK